MHLYNYCRWNMRWKLTALLPWKWKIQLDSMVQDYIVGENQHKNYSFIIDETNVASDMHIRFYVERNAVATVEILIASTSINVHIDCVLRGEGAQVRIAGAYVGQHSDKINVTTMQHHPAPHTRSSLIMKGILRDNAFAQYHGNVRIEK